MRPECLLTYAMERMVDYYHNGKDIKNIGPLKEPLDTFANGYMHEVADVIKSGARSYQPLAQKYFYRFTITSDPIKSVQLPRNGL